ncbi:CUE domain-containing protein 1 isoform X3 [Aphis gossypii]|uniref:CUE domain-containing protein 1 isoform X3 n=1 Tax=Aphis gossypii TaxID=80765 RepID=UPI0021595E57|nr:CUE domain-containing protein 1 isoform X3 [Aphis gossypii]XP_050053555.1 CUE domain-containing protein 1 isoform X3 [Aphis gossypii]XP_050053556.1 CUE domain-containing protein 1 isoform X3 [Aphis gossypii]
MMETVDVASESSEAAAHRPPTVNLDFNEAMADFKTMFPTLEDEVIEAVLRCNKGSVDRTVDQLLTMSCECRGTDLLNESGDNDVGALPTQPAFFDPMLPDVLHNLGKKTARNIGGSSLSRWNPPMLGPLPTDFLRITTTGSCTSQVSESELNDEQIAILLQNEEFLVQLRKNEQFLCTLDKGIPMEEQRFFIPNHTPGDDDAAFKERLKNMGKASRKKFIQIARVFTGKKKKSTARNILNQGNTHTKDNLFLHEEEH